MYIIIPDDYQKVISRLDCFHLLQDHQVTIYHVSQLIKERLLREAKRLLHHGRFSIKEVAWQLGFGDAAYFTRFFTKTRVFPHKTSATGKL